MRTPPEGGVWRGLVLGGCPENFGGVNTPPMGGVDNSLVEIEPIWRVLGKDKAKALPVFHAFTGTDDVGRFSGIGKTKWFQQYLKAGQDICQCTDETTRSR
jgi:hypothetical protein